MSHALPPLPAEAEAALLARARAGGGAREAATAELFRLYRAPVLALCANLVGRGADAEDALQEVFLAVHRALPAFRGEARLATWLYRIAIRTALEVRARRRPGQPIDPELAGPPVEGVLAARHEVRRVAAALDRLPTEHRLVLSLFALEGLPHREVAEILGVAEGTVWSRLHEARRRLAEALGRDR